MSGGELMLIAAAILIPLAIAIVVTLWTLQPAVRRAERAKRARRAAPPAAHPAPTTAHVQEPHSDPG